MKSASVDWATRPATVAPSSTREALASALHECPAGRPDRRQHEGAAWRACETEIAQQIADGVARWFHGPNLAHAREAFHYLAGNEI